MDEIKKQMDHLYHRFKETRVVTDKAINRSLNKMGNIDSTITELNQKLKVIIEEIDEKLSADELNDITKYGETLVDNFSRIAKQ